MPIATRNAAPPDEQNRFRGCLLAGAAGDALGAPVEFDRMGTILAKFGPAGLTEMAPAYGRLGAITDDTQMTLWTGEGILRALVRGQLRGICHPPSVVHLAYLRWLYTQDGRLPATLDEGLVLTGELLTHRELWSRRGPGNTCLSALRQVTEIGSPAKNNSKGCGGVMRVAPVGLLQHSLAGSEPDARAGGRRRAFDLGCETAALTHGHPTGYLTAGVMAAMVFDLLDRQSLLSALHYALPLLVARPDHAETLHSLRQAVELARSTMEPRESIARIGEGWVAEEALALALYCALRARSLEEGVLMAVNHDGDSDSTGLLTGQLLGALHGIDAVPEAWMHALELREVIEGMADDLLAARTWPWGDAAFEAEIVKRYPGG